MCVCICTCGRVVISEKNLCSLCVWLLPLLLSSNVVVCRQERRALAGISKVTSFRFSVVSEGTVYLFFGNKTNYHLLNYINKTQQQKPSILLLVDTTTELIAAPMTRRRTNTSTNTCSTILTLTVAAHCSPCIVLFYFKRSISPLFFVSLP